MRVRAGVRHNRNYWTFGDYLGLGAGAHGKLTLVAGGTHRAHAAPREPRRYLALEPPLRSSVRNIPLQDVRLSSC